MVDWDADGDQDIFLMNRTAPALRYLRNDSPRTNSVFMLRLEGTTANRDAVGARVEVTLKDDPSRPVVRTVKCGEGFLGQSSRWLHFGLGIDATIQMVKVTWPGGKVETIDGCKAGTACAFIEGGLFPEVFQIQASKNQPPAAAPLAPQKAELNGPVALHEPIPFPPLPALTQEGKPWAVEDTGGPLLINVWASWCPDCVGELGAWREAAGEFKSAGLSLALLSADGRDTLHDTRSTDAWPWLKKNNIPFPSGALTDEAFRRINLAHRTAFGAIVSLPVPTSLLLDGQGNIAAVYRGPVAPARIMADVRALKDPQRKMGTLPFPGRWHQAPDSADPSLPLTDLVANGFLEEALGYFKRRSDLVLHRNFVDMAGGLATQCQAAGRYEEAISLNGAALQKSAENVAVLNNLAWLLCSVPDPALRNPGKALTLAAQAAALTKRQDAAILDTLASAQAAAGDRKAAAATAAEALAIATARGPKSLIPGLEKALREYRAR